MRRAAARAASAATLHQLVPPRRRSARPARAGRVAPVVRGAGASTTAARASPSATPRAATERQHRAQSPAHKQLLVATRTSTTTCSRARARSFSSNISLSSVTLALSLLRSSSRWQPHSQDRNSPGHEPPHFHSSSRFRLFLLSSSLALWLTGSLTQGGSRDGIESYLTGQSSDTQPLPTYGADSEVGQNSDQGIVTFGRNVLICSNLSYCNCFEYIRSFIARVKLPSVSITTPGVSPHHTMTCGDVGGRVTDGADSPVAAGWSDRARAMAL